MPQDSITSNKHNRPQLGDLLDFSPTIIYRAVPSGDFRITYISNNLHDILGYRPEQVYADNDFWHNHIHPDDRPMVFANLAQLFVRDWHIVDYRFRHQQGQYLWIHDQLHLVRDADGSVIDVVGSLTDITERKLVEISLEEQEGRLKAIFNTAQDGIITIDTSGCINSVNPAAANIFGYKEDELVGQNVRLLMPETVAAEHDGYLQRYVQTRQPRLVGRGLREVTGRHQDGSEFPLELSIDEIAHTGGSHFVGIFRDITERKDSENEIRQYAHQMQQLVEQRTVELEVARDEALAAEKAMSVFLSNISHELRTPLHGILSFASFGIKKYQRATAEKLGQYFTEIHDSGEHLLALIDDLLDLSKLRAGKMVYDFKTASIDNVIQEVLQEMRLFAREHRVRIDYRCRAESSQTMMDGARIAQVLRNMLSNAIKFSPENSVTTVTLDAAADDGLCLQISDQGVGIPEGEFEYIFDVFAQSSKTRTNAGGTGLGLPICKEIVELGHHGSIKACNGADGGAVFTVTLPVVSEKNKE